MAQFDVFENAFADGMLLDCQSDLLSHFNTRLVAPLLLPDQSPPAISRLNPQFVVAGVKYIMVTQYMSAIELRELGPAVASLATEDRAIIGALDVLITGV